MRKAGIAMVVASVFALGACQKQSDPMQVEELKLETEQQQQSYALGASVGGFVEKKLAAQEEVGINLDKELVVKGFIASLNQQSQLDMTELQVLNNAVDKAFNEARQKMSDEASQKNITEGQAFLEKNKAREEVMETESGLQYEVLTEAEGDKPVATDTVKVHYRGTLLNGEEFDSSYSRNQPAVFPLNRVIPGWTEGVQLMSVGSKYKFYIPSELAYGPRATGKITPNSTLIFEVELLEIVGKEATN